MKPTRDWILTTPMATPELCRLFHGIDCRVCPTASPTPSPVPTEPMKLAEIMQKLRRLQKLEDALQTITELKSYNVLHDAREIARKALSDP